MSIDEKSAQLVVEFTVRDLNRSVDFYTRLAFTLGRRDECFAVLNWGEEHILFLDEDRHLPVMEGLHTNLRIISTRRRHILAAFSGHGCQAFSPGRGSVLRAA